MHIVCFVIFQIIWCLWAMWAVCVSVSDWSTPHILISLCPTMIGICRVHYMNMIFFCPFSCYCFLSIGQSLRPDYTTYDRYIFFNIYFRTWTSSFSFRHVHLIAFCHLILTMHFNPCVTIYHWKAFQLICCLSCLQFPALFVDSFKKKKKPVAI